MRTRRGGPRTGRPARHGGCGRSPGGRVAAGGPARRADRVVPCRVVAHVLQVGRPAVPGGGQLAAERLYRRGVDAARAEHLVVGPGHSVAGEGGPDRAVALGGQVGGLTGDLGDVVGRAAVAYRVVVLQQGSHPRQRAGQVRVGRRGAEALRVSLVLQLDDPDVPDRGQAARSRGAGPGRPAGRAVPGRAGVLVHAASISGSSAAAGSHRRVFAIMPASRDARSR